MIKDLIEKIKSHSDINLISFDIFDTLLFRTAKQPTDVFVMMYKQHPELFPEYTDADDWKKVRQLAEKKPEICRKKKMATGK